MRRTMSKEDFMVILDRQQERGLASKTFVRMKPIGSLHKFGHFCLIAFVRNFF